MMKHDSRYRDDKNPLSIIILTVLFFLLKTFLVGEEIDRAEKSPAQLWEKIRSGDHVVMIRHAYAPGMGDPAYFKIGQCETQRNLSQVGRDQARELGNLFRSHGIHSANVYSSQWCRCLETAELLGLNKVGEANKKGEVGEVTELPFLNSFFQKPQREKPQTQAFIEWLHKQKLTEVTVLVTHQVNITAFTGIVPRSGEMVVIQRKKQGNGFTFTTVGTIMGSLNQ